MKATNTKEHPDRIAPKKRGGDGLTLAPLSWNMVRFTVKDDEELLFDRLNNMAHQCFPHQRDRGERASKPTATCCPWAASVSMRST